MMSPAGTKYLSGSCGRYCRAPAATVGMWIYRFRSDLVYPSTIHPSMKNHQPSGHRSIDPSSQLSISPSLNLSVCPFVYLLCISCLSSVYSCILFVYLICVSYPCILSVYLICVSYLCILSILSTLPILSILSILSIPSILSILSILLSVCLPYLIFF